MPTKANGKARVKAVRAWGFVQCAENGTNFLGLAIEPTAEKVRKNYLTGRHSARWTLPPGWARACRVTLVPGHIGTDFKIVPLRPCAKKPRAKKGGRRG